MEKWSLIRVRVTYPNPNVGTVENVFWARRDRMDGEEIWRNYNGSWCCYEDIDVIEELEVEDYWDLPFEKTSFYKELTGHEDSHQGWLSPDGKFFPCAFGRHDVYAVYILRKNVIELEKENWGRVVERNSAHGVLFRRDCEPTEAQARWILGRLHHGDL